MRILLFLLLPFFSLAQKLPFSSFENTDLLNKYVLGSNFGAVDGKVKPVTVGALSSELGLARPVGEVVYGTGTGVTSNASQKIVNGHQTNSSHTFLNQMWDIFPSTTITVQSATATNNNIQGNLQSSMIRDLANGDAITIDVGNTRSIYAVNFGTYFYNDWRFIPKNYRIEYSSDNITYINAVTVTNNANVLVSHIINATCRYIKIIIDATQTGFVVNITQIQLFTKYFNLNNAAFWSSLDNHSYLMQSHNMLRLKRYNSTTAVQIAVPLGSILFNENGDIGTSTLPLRRNAANTKYDSENLEIVNVANGTTPTSAVNLSQLSVNTTPNLVGNGFSSPLDLSNTGVAAGTYNSLTIDAKGRVTAGTNVPIPKATEALNAITRISGTKDTFLLGGVLDRNTTITTGLKNLNFHSSNAGGSGDFDINSSYFKALIYTGNDSTIVTQTPAGYKIQTQNNDLTGFGARDVYSTYETTVAGYQRLNQTDNFFQTDTGIENYNGETSIYTKAKGATGIYTKMFSNKTYAGISTVFGSWIQNDVLGNVFVKNKDVVNSIDAQGQELSNSTHALVLLDNSNGEVGYRRMSNRKIATGIITSSSPFTFSNEDVVITEYLSPLIPFEVILPPPSFGRTVIIGNQAGQASSSSWRLTAPAGSMFQDNSGNFYQTFLWSGRKHLICDGMNWYLLN